VTYHHEDETWWAESEDVPGFSAAAEHLSELRRLVREGLMFHLDLDSAELRESMADSGVVASIEFVDAPFGVLMNSSSRATSGAAYTVTGTETSWFVSPLLHRVAS
jgi:predicted RNase H-like HicB family nuclease